MNNIYKLKFDRRTNSLIAVSELATNAETASSSSNNPNPENSPGKVANHSSSEDSSSLHMTTLSSFLLTTSGIGLAGLGLSLGAQAAPNGMTVVSGQANMVTDGLVTTITNSPKAIINWKSFNINTNEVVRFIQENAQSSVLNRVVGKDISKILGSLQSNGKVFLINPNGIIFGKGSTIDVAGLVASTLDISNENFKQGKYLFSKDKDQKIASVINQGLITIKGDGSLALVGGQVVNKGVLEARNGTVYLLAGNSIEVADFKNPNISFKVEATNKAINLGNILGRNVSLVGNKVLHGQAEGLDSFADIVGAEDASAGNAKIIASGEVLLFGGSQSNFTQHTTQKNAEVTGDRNSMVQSNARIDVTNKEGKAGKVTILGDQIILGSKSDIDASGKSGGQVRVGGDPYGKGDYKLAQGTIANEHQVINVSGTEGDAGNSILWGDWASVDGTFLANSDQGYAGLVETSGKTLEIQDNIKVRTHSQVGSSHVGRWLLDPDNIFVIPDSDPRASRKTNIKPRQDGSASFVAGGRSRGGYHYTFSNSSGDTYITQSQLSS